MSEIAFQQPVKDSVRKINHEIAVGEDLEFQRTWWKFERTIWIVFALLIAGDLAGLFGRGPMANASIANDAMSLRYERIERSGTPSMLHVDFKASAIHDGKIRLYVSNTVVDHLGAQRIIPSPESSTVGEGGLTYTFPATTVPANITFALEPTSFGRTHFVVQVPGSPALQASVFVMP